MMEVVRSNSRIQLSHLQRQALIYIRQSTLPQVRDNLGSSLRQYDLKKRAIELGWSAQSVELIDQDQGHSGASTVGRDGFHYLTLQVSLGQAGAIFSLKASRLARSCTDWYRLLEICALTHTLVIDEEGIYDPAFYNDRLLLGFKGTMSEAELHWLHQRMQGGKLAKAKLGQLRSRLPVGLVYTPGGQVVLDPDQEIQKAVRLVFKLFEQSSSALAVVKKFNAQGLRFPTRLVSRTKSEEIIWKPLDHQRVLSLLHNPFYAGAYVYGRTHLSKQIVLNAASNSITTNQIQRVKPEDWPIVIVQAHPGYLTWEQFLANNRRLEDNRTFSSEKQRGAVRNGPAILQGIVWCSKCGRRMRVRYQEESTLPYYRCDYQHRQKGLKVCQTVRGDLVDQAVANKLLEAVLPAQLQIALNTLEQLVQEEQHYERQWQLRLERVRYEANLARRRFLAVEPENRLVARTLEREWDEKLSEVEKLEQEHQQRLQPSQFQNTSENRELIMELAHNLPLVWYSATTEQAERKQLLRLVIKTVSLRLGEQDIEVTIVWQTEAVTAFAIHYPWQELRSHRTPAEILEKIKQLTLDHTDAQVAKLLNEAGYKTGIGRSFTALSVTQLRQDYGIKRGELLDLAAQGEENNFKYYRAGEVAKLLNIDPSTVVDWCRAGKLEAVRAYPNGERWVKLNLELIEQLRKPERRCWKTLNK